MWDKLLAVSVGSFCCGQIDQIDHDLDNLVPNLPFWDAVQDLYSADPTRETIARSCRLHGFHLATWARSYRSYRSYTLGIHLPCLADVDHSVSLGIGDLSVAWKYWLVGSAAARGTSSAGADVGFRAVRVALPRVCDWGHTLAHFRAYIAAAAAAAVAPCCGPHNRIYQQSCNNIPYFFWWCPLTLLSTFFIGRSVMKQSTLKTVKINLFGGAE